MRRSDDPVKLVAPDAHQYVGADAAAQRVRLRRVVPRARRGRGERRFVVTEIDAASGVAVRAATPTTRSLRRRVAFFHCDRARPFIDLRSDRVHRPQPLACRGRRRWRAKRSQGRAGAGLDPCAALQVIVEIPPGESRQVAFVLGRGRGPRPRRRPGRAVSATSTKCRRHARGAEQFWDDTLGAVQVHTPDDSFDLLVNRWLLYQTLSCRIWARSGPYSARRRVRLPRSAAGRAGAAPLAARICAASTCCARRRGSSSKATCSTGGIRRAAAAPARAAPTICSGCRTPSPRTSRHTGDDSVLDEDRAVPRGAAARARAARGLLPAVGVGRNGDAVRARVPRHRSLD